MKIEAQIKVMNDAALNVPHVRFETDTASGALSLFWDGKEIELRRSELVEFLHRTQPFKAEPKGEE